MAEKQVFYFRSIEGLRFWMAWWVVLGHLANVAGVPALLPNYMSPVFNGRVAVDVFIIVSGFVITHLIVTTNESYQSYLTRRIMRLWPAYLIGLGLLVFLPQAYEFTFVDLPFGVDVANKRAEFASVQGNYAVHLLSHLALTNGVIPTSWLPYSDSAILSPAWSLSLEWQFYLVAPYIVAFAAKRYLNSVILAVAAISAVLLMHYQQLMYWRFPSFLLLSGHFFAIGIICRLYIKPLLKVVNSKYWVPCVLVFGIFAMALVDARTDSTFGRELIIWGVWLRFLRLDNQPEAQESQMLLFFHRTFANNTAIRHLGNASYSTYILHIPVVAIVVWLSSIVVPLTDQRVMICVTFLSVIPIVIISLWTYRFIERPCNELGRRIVSSWSTGKGA